MSNEKPTCNVIDSNGTQAYAQDPVSFIASVTKQGTAWSSLVSSCCLSSILLIPLGLSYNKNGFDVITIVLIIILLSIMSSMSNAYTQMNATPDGYTTDCIKDEKLVEKKD